MGFFIGALVVVLAVFLPPFWMKALLVPFAHSEEEWGWLHQGWWGAYDLILCIALGALLLLLFYHLRKGPVL